MGETALDHNVSGSSVIRRRVFSQVNGVTSNELNRTVIVLSQRSLGIENLLQISHLLMRMSNLLLLMLM